MKKKSFFNIILALMLVALCIIPSNMKALAEDKDAESLVLVESYKVTNDMITPGEDFTLTLTLKNYSDSVTAEDTIVTMTNPDGVAPVYGVSSEVYVGTMKPGEVREVSMDYNTWNTIDTETLDFGVGIYTRDVSRPFVLRIKAGVDESLKIENVKIPSEYTVGKRADVSMKLSVLGTENVSNIVLYAESDGKEIAKNNIGILTPGTSKTQSIGLTFAEEGVHTFTLKLKYTETDGTNNEVEIYSNEINVEKAEKVLNNTTENQAEKESINKTVVIAISGILIALVCAIILVLVRKRGNK